MAVVVTAVLTVAAKVAVVVIVLTVVVILLIAIEVAILDVVMWKRQSRRNSVPLIHEHDFQQLEE